MAKDSTLKTSGNVSSLESIDKAISNIRVRGKQLRNLCHETLVAVIDHYIAHGDYTRLPLLTAAVKDSLGSSVSASMNTWVARFVPSLEWSDEDRAFKHNKATKKEVLSVPEDKPIKSKTLKGADDKPILYHGDARKIPFWELERDAEQKPFEFGAAFITLLKRAERALEKNVKEHGHNDVSLTQIERLEAIGIELGIVKPADAHYVGKTEGVVTPAEEPVADAA